MPFRKKTKAIKKSRKGRFRKRKSKKSSVNKKVVKQIVKQALDDNQEDKYLLDGSFTNHAENYDPGTSTILFNISPNIHQGTDVSQRVGNKVRLKYFKSFLRLLPAKYSLSATMASDPTYITNFFRANPSYKCYIVRITNDIVNKLTSSELRDVLRAKYRRPGTCWQDFAQDPGQKGLSGIKLLHKFEMTPKWRVINSTGDPLAMSGGYDSLTGSINMSPTQVKQTRMVSVPQYTYKEIYTNSVAQKVEISNNDNGVMRYQYWMFVQCNTNYQNTSYDSIDQPQSFDMRNIWVYEDA